MDQDGTFSRALELRWGSAFRATASGPQTLRLRLKLISVKAMNPFDLDLSETRDQDFVLRALSTVYHGGKEGG